MRKLLLQDWTESKLNLALAGKELSEADKLNYLGSCISTGGRTSDEMFSSIQKARLVFTNFGHPVINLKLRLHRNNKVGSKARR